MSSLKAKCCHGCRPMTPHSTGQTGGKRGHPPVRWVKGTHPASKKQLLPESRQGRSHPLSGADIFNLGINSRKMTESPPSNEHSGKDPKVSSRSARVRTGTICQGAHREGVKKATIPEGTISGWESGRECGHPGSRQQAGTATQTPKAE